MSHLTDVQMAEAAERPADQPVSGHLAGCAACAAKVQQLRLILDAVACSEIPEPSPLFWEGFSARVKAGIDEPPQPVSTWWPGGRLAWLGIPAIFLAGAIGFYTTRTPLEAPRSTPVVALDEIPAPSEDDIEQDEAWAVMRSLAVDLHYDDAVEAGVLPRAGAVERAATELSEAERAELVRLIRDELKRMGA